MKLSLPEIHVDAGLKASMAAVSAKFDSIAAAEKVASGESITASLQHNELWLRFSGNVRSTIEKRGYVVVRGLDADDGRSLLIVSTAFGAPFASYGLRRIVRRFRMSPWTTELSHTTKGGDFHTDGNVAQVPPTGTAIQCEHPDPGAPEYAEQRVAYLPDLLARLGAGTATDRSALHFLTLTDAVMTHERKHEVWKGRLVDQDTIRYHPESLRTAVRRGYYSEATDVEPFIAAIHRAAMESSVPFQTLPGDTVLVLNKKALHYRGPCSVRFTRFPTEFESRSVLMLHVGAGSG